MDEAAAPLAQLVAGLLLGGASAAVRSESAAALKALWRLLEGQHAPEALQVRPWEARLALSPNSFTCHKT